MPAALSIGERRQIVVKREAGQSVRSISKELGRDYEIVRKIYHHYIQSGQLEADLPSERTLQRWFKRNGL